VPEKGAAVAVPEKGAAVASVFFTRSLARVGGKGRGREDKVDGSFFLLFLFCFQRAWRQNSRQNVCQRNFWTSKRSGS